MAEDHCREALKLATLMNFGMEIAHSERNMAQLWKRNNNFYAACYHMNRAKKQLSYLREHPSNPPIGAGFKKIEYLNNQISDLEKEITCERIEHDILRAKKIKKNKPY